MDLRSFMRDPEVKTGLSPDFEIAKALFENPTKILYFKNIKGYKFDSVGNFITSRNDIYRSLNTDRVNYINNVLGKFERPIKPFVLDSAPCQENECSIYDLPVLKHFERDGGKYITSGIVIANDPEFGRNASIHRLMIHDNNRLGIRIVPRHLHEYLNRAENREEDLEIAIVIGVHPVVFYASSYSPPLGYDEMALAGALMGKPLEVVKCLTVDLEVPAYSEFVIEGKILNNVREDEGPFADVTGTYDRIRKEPIIEISKVTHRNDAVYQALLPSSIEHRLFMGMPQEPRIYKSVSELGPTTNVCLTDGGKNWLEGVVAISKGVNDPKKFIEKAFDGHPSMKHVILVNDDIDIFDPNDVGFAISTRFQAHKDAYVYGAMRGSTLDPSTDEDGKTTKVGIDATIPEGMESEYEFAKIP